MPNLLEMVARYVALHDRARLRGQRTRDAHARMHDAGFADLEPGGIVAVQRPGSPETALCDTAEQIDELFAAAIAAGGAEGQAWIEQRDAAQARLAVISAARDRFGIPALEGAEEAIWADIDQLGAMIRAAPAASMAEIAAKLRALVANASVFDANSDTFDRRAVINVLADAERLATARCES